jgi:L-alanine-DL-glutamate epimerase-like enolase superfamily enzyme
VVRWKGSTVPLPAQLIEAKALDYIQFDTNRVGGLTAARVVLVSSQASRSPKNGLIELSDDVPGLGLEINEAELAHFEVIE